MSLQLSSYVRVLGGIGDKAIDDLKQLGIVSIRDLLWYVPFRYDDYSRIVFINEMRLGQICTVRGVVESIQTRPSKNKRIQLVEATVRDETGVLKVIWFNQRYLERTIPMGTLVSLSGSLDFRFGRAMVNPVVERGDAGIHTGRIVPVYGLSGSLTMRKMRHAMKEALIALQHQTEWLPEGIIQQEKFLSLADALRGIHFPESQTHLLKCIERLKFDEVFLHQLMFADVRKSMHQQTARAFEIHESTLKSFVAKLTFTLTPSQKTSLWEIVQDMHKPHPMNRLLQGDVGAGKSVVAAGAAWQVMQQGGNVVYLAPTEILATQQHAVFQNWLGENVVLWTRTMQKIGNEAVKRSHLETWIHDQKGICVIGTHALLQTHVTLPLFDFVVIDEQHRFGVEQRHALLHNHTSVAPHLLSMTATPIPRSLTLTLYGDLDVSLLTHLPKGRKPVATALVGHTQEEGMWKHIKSLVDRGAQVFVVCPLIDPSDQSGMISVKDTRSRLTKILNGCTIGLLHGKLKSDEKDRVLLEFRDQKIQVLVCTTVVEVGIDIPNARVMVVLNAERFGLAQLHQLRGRVGRSDIQSYCYLVPEHRTSVSEERLTALEQTHDGFILAQKDLELRGAGNIFGNAQSGFPDFRFATPADVDVMKKARDYAVRLLDTDATLMHHSRVKEKMSDEFERVHLE